MHVQDAIDQLEEVILSSPRVPGWRTLVDEEELLAYLDQIRDNLPVAFEEAENLLKQRETILQEAKRYAHEIIAGAEQKAKKLLDESVILRQAQMQAEQVLRQTQKEREELRRQSLSEAEQLQRDANRYVDQVLQDLEGKLLDSLRVIRNGRQNLPH